MLNYSEPLYRPPSEASSLIFQVTEGCSFNRCSFCSMYRSKCFSEKPLTEVFAEIEEASMLFPQAKRVFLADGDALVRSTDDLLFILDKLYEQFPLLERVSSYALPSNLLSKSTAELSRLNQHGLALIYYGIESGNALILKKITKGATAEGIKEGLDKASETGLVVSATVILGLGGEQLWQAHIDSTAELVNSVQLDYLSTLQLTLEPEIKKAFIERFQRKGKGYIQQSDIAILRELARLIDQLAPIKPLIFRSNHASNALSLKGVIPNDGERLLAEVNTALQDDSLLRPSWMRAL